MTIPPAAFFAELRAVASRIGCQPLDLMQVMYAESGVSAASENQASGASGLIQLMPFNLPGVGFTGTTAQFRALTELEQLPYVERYFEPWKRYGLTNVNRVYQAVFLPGTLPLGSDDATAIAVRGGRLNSAYVANSSVDHGNKGFITVGDLRQAVLERCTGRRWVELVAALSNAAGQQTEAKTMNEQWCPFAIRRVGAMGLGAKHGYPGGIQGVPADNLMTAAKRGEVKHDSTGPLAPTLGVLDTHPINSWQFTVDDSGIYQHYPVDANCWHGNDTDPDDDVRANVDLVGVEHTRVGGALALTTRQVQLTTQLSAWLKETRGFKYAARIMAGVDQRGSWLLTEHNEVGNAPTACPSGRIPWEVITTSLQEADMPEGHVLTAEENAQILALIALSNFIRNGWNPGDLIPQDRAAIKAAAERVPA